MSQLEQIAVVGNGRQNNKSFTVNAGESVTCYFKASGNDTATKKYYNIKGDAKRCGILVNNISTVTHINGFQLSSPLPIGKDQWNVWNRGIRWDKITVKATSDSTTFQVYAY